MAFACSAAGTEGQPVNRFLAIVGASGSGKSSAARAGLVAALKHDGIPGSSRWPVAILRPLTMRADFYAKCAANAELAAAFSDWCYDCNSKRPAISL